MRRAAALAFALARRIGDAAQVGGLHHVQAHACAIQPVDHRAGRLLADLRRGRRRVDAAQQIAPVVSAAGIVGEEEVRLATRRRRGHVLKHKFIVMRAIAPRRVERRIIANDGIGRRLLLLRRGFARAEQRERPVGFGRLCRRRIGRGRRDGRRHIASSYRRRLRLDGRRRNRLEDQIVGLQPELVGRENFPNVDRVLAEFVKRPAVIKGLTIPS